MDVLNESEHPAATWARQQRFTPQQLDCTTAVVLKILDGKCKMLPGEKVAVIAIYQVVRQQGGELFDSEVHRLIDLALQQEKPKLAEPIHQLRLTAESLIPKPVMKRYKSMLRDGLFG
jgi:hypothetical protein